MEAKVLSEAKVYVGTYAKYNNGSLSGAWLDLSDYSDKEEFYEACRELHKDEEDAEYMFQDWENVPEGLIDESWISENFFALRDAVEDLSDTEQEAFFVWCNYKSHDLGEEDADDLVRDFRDEYQGEYDDEEDFGVATEYAHQCYQVLLRAGERRQTAILWRYHPCQRVQEPAPEPCLHVSMYTALHWIHST